MLFFVIFSNMVIVISDNFFLADTDTDSPIFRTPSSSSCEGAEK